MFGRYLNAEERKKIKEAKDKERMLNEYTAGAVARMTPKPTTKKLRGGME